MEIIFDNVGYKDKLNGVNLKIDNSSITGIIGKNKEYFIKLLLGDVIPLIGNLNINGVNSSVENKLLIKKQISYIQKVPFRTFKNEIVLAEIASIVDSKQYKSKNINKKIKDAFSLIGLDESYLTRSFSTLSSSELYLVQIAIELICNPKIIILENPFSILDYHNKKRLLKLLKALKEKYHKMIFISDDDVDVLYQYTDKILLVNDCNRVNIYNTYDFFTSIKFLKANNIALPKLVKVSYLGKLKGIKLTYQKDIRDIIKDIYKHV
ncbi:MAG: ATP-binding cassette domain-containing protein [Bacilli bacterium]